jgi:small subunit ribosomal protein S20
LPNIKAAEKWAKQSEKRETRNKSTKNRLRTLFKRAVDSDENAAAQLAESAYDKAASKGIVHPNKAARKKSRLAQARKREDSRRQSEEIDVRDAPSGVDVDRQASLYVGPRERQELLANEGPQRFDAARLERDAVPPLLVDARDRIGRRP